MIVKVNTPSVSEKFQISDHLTLLEFKHFLGDRLKIPSFELEFLIGFPPRLLQTATPSQKLVDIGITNGTALTVRPSLTKKAFFEKLLELGYDESVVISVLEEAEQLSIEEAINTCDQISATQPAKFDLERVSIAADNSCLFNSIRYLLQLTDADADYLRQIVANVIVSDPKTYNAEFLDKDPKDYVAWIMKSEHWGGEIEISILSSFFEIEIAVIDIRSTIILPYGQGKGYSKKILLLYDGIHYDALVQRDRRRKTIVSQFDPSNEEVLSQAQALAADLQKKKLFVNIATGDLYCNQCFTVLKGEKEAVEHAKNTGHTNFGQKA